MVIYVDVQTTKVNFRVFKVLIYHPHKRNARVATNDRAPMFPSTYSTSCLQRHRRSVWNAHQQTITNRVTQTMKTVHVVRYEPPYCWQSATFPTYFLTKVNRLESFHVTEKGRLDSSLPTYGLQMHNAWSTTWQLLLCCKIPQMFDVRTFGVVPITPKVDVHIFFN